MKSQIYSSVLFAALAAAAPAPLQKREDIDETILNYALTLEHLEAAFYKEGLAKYSAEDFTNAGFKERRFYQKLTKIGEDEAAHVEVIQATQAALGYSSTEACEYDFGITSPSVFVQTAGILEGVGVTAYLGAASKVTNKAVLTAAGSILSIEARHNAWIRNTRRSSPFPQAFETPLDFSQVYSLAAGFITSCPSTNPTLPVTAFPTLTAAGAKTFKMGSAIVLSLPDGFSAPTGAVYVAWPTLDSANIQDATYDAAANTITTTVPTQDTYGPRGQVYAILINDNNGTVTDDNTLAGPAIVSVQ